MLCFAFTSRYGSAGMLPLYGACCFCACVYAWLRLATGLLISGSAFLLSDWLADSFYGNPTLAPLFKIYGCSVLVSAFSGVYEPILRIYNRFASIIVPQVLGGLTTLMIIGVYFYANRSYDLKIVIAAFTSGVLVQTVPPLVRALGLVWPSLSSIRVKEAALSLATYRTELTRCLFHSNLSGYLKFAISPGDLFLLGIFTTPRQVALYALAKQLTAPLAILQANIQTAITPEVTALTATGKFDQLKRLVRRYALSVFVLGGLMVVSILLVGRLFIFWLSQPEYVNALPVFYAVLVAAWAMLVLLVFRPLALSLDLLRWHNLAQLSSTLILLILIIAGGLSAMTLAYVHLAEILIFRILFSIPVWMRLRALARKRAG
jgi:O-antigen/teichoic acid export membrane protein